MNFVNLKRQTFTVTYAGVTYSKEFYTPAISVTGVENETHPNWNATAPYAEGAYVIVPELKSIYKRYCADVIKRHGLPKTLNEYIKASLEYL